MNWNPLLPLPLPPQMKILSKRLYQSIKGNCQTKPPSSSSSSSARGGASSTTPRKSLLKHGDEKLLKWVYGLAVLMTVIHSQQKYTEHLLHFILLHPSIFYTPTHTCCCCHLVNAYEAASLSLLNSGFSFQHVVSYWCSIVTMVLERTTAELQSWDRWPCTRTHTYTHSRWCSHLANAFKEAPTTV